MRISAFCFSALRYGFFYFPYFIPKLLRYNWFVRIANYNPLTFIFYIAFVVLIGNRTVALLHHMSQIGRIL